MTSIIDLRGRLKTANHCGAVLDDPTPMPESALLMATAQIMAEGGAKHSPVNCNTVNSKTNCAASKKAKSGAARKRGAFKGVRCHRCSRATRDVRSLLEQYYSSS